MCINLFNAPHGPVNGLSPPFTDEKLEAQLSNLVEAQWWGRDFNQGARLSQPLVASSSPSGS